MFGFYSYTLNGVTTAKEIKQKIISDKASTIVVMNGLATTAGSSLHTFASMGIMQPTNLAITIVANSANETARHIYQV